MFPRLEPFFEKFFLLLNCFIVNQVPPSQRFKPSKKENSNAIPWWVWLGIGSASSTDYEQEMKEQEGKTMFDWISVASLFENTGL